MLMLGELSLDWRGMVRVREGDEMLWERGRGARKVRGGEHRGWRTQRASNSRRATRHPVMGGRHNLDKITSFRCCLSRA